MRGFYMTRNTKEGFGQSRSLIDRVKDIDPEQADYCILRMYTWPNAVLTRIANYTEMGAEIDTALQDGTNRLNATKHPSKINMLTFIAEQQAFAEKLSKEDRYYKPILPITQIHLPDLSKPFQWDSDVAQQSHTLISDLAYYVTRCKNPAADTEYKKFFGAYDKFRSKQHIEIQNRLYRIQRSISKQ